jgi:hypothetical protein
MIPLPQERGGSIFLPFPPSRGKMIDFRDGLLAASPQKLIILCSDESDVMYDEDLKKERVVITNFSQ